MNDKLRESWEYEFAIDPLTKANLFEFGNELRAKAGTRPPLDWQVRVHVPQPKASTWLVGAGLVAKTQRDFHGDRIGAFDISSALQEIVTAESPADIAASGARLELAWIKLMLELDRMRYQP
jgi:hypothetical protein